VLSRDIEGDFLMIRWIISSSLQFRFLVIVLAAAMMAYGVSSLSEAPVNIYPEFNPPLVEIQTEALGLSAAEMEALITVPPDLLGDGNRVVLNSPCLRAWNRPYPGTADGAGAFDGDICAAERVKSADHVAAAVDDQPGHDCWAFVAGTLPD